MMFRAFFLSTVFCGLAAAASAQTFDCSFKDGTANRTWIQDRYVIQYDQASGTAQAIDPLINALHGGPIAADVLEDTKGKIVFSWQVKTGDSDGKSVTMRYRATWFKGPQRMRMAALPRGYDTMFEAQGTCKVG